MIRPYRRAIQRAAWLAALGLAGLSDSSIAADAPVAPAAPDQSTLNAEMEPLAVSRSLILDITNGADRAIAVGERGHILISESRQDWRQVDKVPTRSNLTAVTAVGNQAWAVGHDGVILHSADGGQTWTRQRAAPYQIGSEDPHNGAPLLDVLFLDEKKGFAIGAYAMVLQTTDGGENWTPMQLVEPAAESPDISKTTRAAESTGENFSFSASELQVSDETDPHLNSIARTGDGSLMIVGERGSGFRSTDGGASWKRLKLPYKGSMFGVIGYSGRHVLAFGLRGHVLESQDLGDSWTEVASGTELSLMGGIGVGDGGAVLVGANGIVLTRASANDSFKAHTDPQGAVLSSVLSLANAPGSELVVVGENGVARYQPNTTEAK